MGETPLSPIATRFTEKALEVISRAEHQSSADTPAHIGPHEILLSLLQQENNQAQQMLNHLGLDPAQISNGLGPDPDNTPPPSGAPELSPKGKKVIELAVDEAIRSRASSISTPHLLIGILREEDSAAAITLRKAGLELQAARDHTANSATQE